MCYSVIRYHQRKEVKMDVKLSVRSKVTTIVRKWQVFGEKFSVCHSAWSNDAHKKCFAIRFILVIMRLYIQTQFTINLTTKKEKNTTFFYSMFSNERKRNVSKIKFSNKEMLIFSSRLSLVFAKHTLVWYCQGKHWNKNQTVEQSIFLSWFDKSMGSSPQYFWTLF